MTKVFLDTELRYGCWDSTPGEGHSYALYASGQ